MSMRVKIYRKRFYENTLTRIRGAYLYLINVNKKGREERNVLGKCISLEDTFFFFSRALEPTEILTSIYKARLQPY